ncbi:hypothetical protein [Catellatospora bangladeshensis]|uniref:Uncharacterized protein n=2 Tax=Catellatospora bangladeshensis TaxID=310355 RepID=A0A8J3JUX1_9ACTN|nr:hypothetical protein [Catellatospora bangladeshensis]GIF85518.1 hypothetical protein Cba03nite_68670 [Catellatospora bangladeshensis]
MRRLMSQTAWSRALTACGAAAFVFGAALVAAGAGQPAKAWANAPISISADTLGVTAADFATRDCSPLYGGGPLAGQDVWVFDLPGDHMVTGDFTSVQATFTVPDGGEVTASVPDEGGSIVLEETSRAWIALPAGWTLTGAKAEVSGSAESFTLAQTCPAEGAGGPAPDPSAAPDPSGAPIADPSAPPAEPDPSGSPVPGAFASPAPPVDPSAAPAPPADPIVPPADPIVPPVDPSAAPEPPVEPIVPPVAPDPSAAPEPPADPFTPPVAPEPSSEPIAPSAAPEPPVAPSAAPEPPVAPSEEPPSRPVRPQPVEPPANPGPAAPRPAAGWQGAAALGAVWDDILDAFPW